MIISWGHSRPLESSLFSLVTQSSSVFSSRPSSSQVNRCCGEPGRRAGELVSEGSERFTLQRQSVCVSHPPPPWRIRCLSFCWAFPSTPSSALWHRAFVYWAGATQEKRLLSVLWVNILNIDFPLGLNMFSLCSEWPRSSCWKPLLCCCKSSWENPLKTFFFKQSRKLSNHPVISWVVLG